jgi:hypothetical protein
MVRKAILILPLLATAGAAPAQAPAENDYYVRNETSRTFSCGMRREPRRLVHRFLLRRGSDYRHETADGEARTLLCDTRHPTQRFRMQAGVRYALTERAGYVTLRRIEDSPSAP